MFWDVCVAFWKETLYLPAGSEMSSSLRITCLRKAQRPVWSTRPEGKKQCPQGECGSQQHHWALAVTGASYLNTVTTVVQLASDLRNRIPIFLEGKTKAQGRLKTQTGPRSRQGWGCDARWAAAVPGAGDQHRKPVILEPSCVCPRERTRQGPPFLS